MNMSYYVICTLLITNLVKTYMKNTNKTSELQNVTICDNILVMSLKV